MCCYSRVYYFISICIFHCSQCLIDYSCVFLFSNCSLELKRDTWDEYLRGRQLNKVSQGTGNENLALSRSVESQALSEISSHPSDSISSLEGDGLQVSFISHSAAAEVSFST